MILAEARDQARLDVLYWANQVRRANFGNQVKFCTIAAGKVGACGEDCRWCSQSARYATHIPPQPARATVASLVQASEEALRGGAFCFSIVNSGLQPSEVDLQDFQAAAAAVAATGREVRGASLGMLDDDTAARLYAMGVRRYNHNLETSRRFYASVVSSHDYDSRLATLAAARRAGMQLCCGGLFGLGETWEDRVDLALTLREEVDPDTSPLNFLHPIPGTPLQANTPLEPMECLHIVALFRLMLPTVDLKVAGGRQVNLRELQSWMYYAGATSCMVGNYLTTVGRDVQADKQLLADLGLELVTEFTKPAVASPARQA